MKFFYKLKRWINARKPSEALLEIIAVRDKKIKELRDRIDNKKEPPLYPCEKNGQHEVYNVKKRTPDDESEIDMINAGWKWYGKCKHCGYTIQSKDGKDLLASQKENDSG